jgi:hypothetical protein
MARAGSKLEYCVRTGKQALDEIYGMTVFEYLKHNPEESRIFDNAMTGLSSIDGPAVADTYNFAGVQNIVDVAGGHGLLLATLLERNPHLKGTLYEVPMCWRELKQVPSSHIWTGALWPPATRAVLFGPCRRRCLHYETRHS